MPIARQKKTQEKKSVVGRTERERRRPCRYCDTKADEIRYTDLTALRRAVSERGKTRSRRVTGTCRRHQNQVAVAIKRAREMALLPYVDS
jgi:small subunit ribosomal protein S18